MLARSLLPKGHALIYSRNMSSHVIQNKHFKPGPYPKTQKEREAAAKKYNLHPSQYEPYEDDGFGYGDYPKIPKLSTEARDDYYPWDYPALKRNFDEPIHVDEILINDTRMNVNKRELISGPKKLLTFLTVMGTFIGLYVFLEDYKMYPPVMVKQYSRNGQHYTFEPINSPNH